MKVLGMGNALVDVLAQIDSDNILQELNLPKGSMTLIDENMFKEVSVILEKLNPSIVSGGSASNTIVGLASLGVNTGFIGRVGDDKFGKIYKADLEKYGVVSHLTKVDEISGVASAFISKDGERTFGTYLGAAALLSAAELKAETFVGYDYFFIEGYLVQSHELIECAVQLAKKAGAKIAIDMASYNIVEANLKFLTTIISKYVDIVFANEEEAKALTGLEPEQAVIALAKITDLVVVKVGAKGSWVQRANEKVFVPANKVNCLDTTGAGDLYAAGFIYGLINSKSLEACARIGTLLGGEVVQTIGPKIQENRWNAIKSEIGKL